MSNIENSPSTMQNMVSISVIAGSIGMTLDELLTYIALMEEDLDGKYDTLIYDIEGTLCVTRFIYLTILASGNLLILTDILSEFLYANDSDTINEVFFEAEDPHPPTVH